MTGFAKTRPLKLSEAGKLLPPEASYAYVYKTDSTNTLALSGDWPQYVVIAADHQYGGRGRLGRTWVSPPGLNLYFSMVLNPPVPKASWGSISLVAGIAVARVLSAGGFDPGLKWPNDVLLDGLKAAGILVEARDQRLVAGIGINVNQTEFGELTGKATSLTQVAGGSLDRARLLAAVVTEFFHAYRQWLQLGFGAFLSPWQRYDVLVGQRVKANHRGRELVGTALGVTGAGELVLDVDGDSLTLNSGEVTLEKIYS